MSTPELETAWRVQSKQERKKQLEEFIVAIFKKTPGKLTSALLEKSLLADPRDFKKLEFWDMLKDMEDRQLLRYEDSANPGYRYVGPREEKKAEPVVEAPPPPRVFRVPAPEQAKEQEPVKAPEVPTSRGLKNTTDDDIVQFIRTTAPTTVDIAKWMNASYVTVGTRLDVMKARGIIDRVSPRGSWIVGMRSPARQSGPVTRPDSISLSIPAAAPDPADTVLPQNFSYKFGEDGSITFTGLLHHRKIVLPPEEVIKIAEILSMTPVDRAKKLIAFNTPPIG